MNNEEEKKAIELVESKDGTMVVTDQRQAVTKHETNGIIPDARNLFQLAEGLVRSEMFPNVKNKYGALAIIEYGRELGIKPVVALQTMSVVKGRICIEAKLMQALFEQREGIITVLEKTPEICRLMFDSPNKEPFEETFTAEDAERAKLADKDNYQKYPEEMNYYRCLSKGLRVYDPGAILGLYSVEEMDPDAAAFEEAKAYDKKVAAKKKEKEKPAAPPAEEKKPEPKKKKASPREKTGKVEKTKQEGSDQEVATPNQPKVKPGEGDPSKLTDQERIEIVKTDIMEDFTVRYGTQHQKENPDMPLKDYIKEKYRRFKLFLKWFQEKKNVEEGKKLCFVAVNEHGFLSLSEGNVANVEIMWEKKDFTLSNFFEWEKLPPEEEDEDPPF